MYIYSFLLGFVAALCIGPVLLALLRIYHIANSAIVYPLSSFLFCISNSNIEDLVLLNVCAFAWCLYAHLRVPSYGAVVRAFLFQLMQTVRYRNFNFPETTSCPITLLPLSENDVMRCESCRALFGAIAIKEWLFSKSPTCPVCKERWANWAVYKHKREASDLQ